MRFTHYTDYALRVLMYLGIRQGEVCKTREIAETYKISEAHLVKVVNHLGAIGVVRTVRGRGGGLTLAMDASEIVIGEVVRSTEEDRSLVECFDEETNSCPITKACILKRALGEALDAFFETLDDYTLEDLLSPKRQLRTLLELKPPPRVRS